MHESRVASRYAKSLIDLSKEQNILEDVNRDMNLFLNICKGTPQLVRVMKNPIINHDKKLAILREMLQNKVHRITFAMFDIIGRKHREGYLYEISKEFVRQYKEMKGIHSAEIITTQPITDEQRSRFTQMVANNGQQVELKETVDEKIIGGFILKMGDRQIDESVKSKLLKLKSNFRDNPYLVKY